MLAAWLAILLSAEMAVLVFLGARGLAAGLSIPVTVVSCLALSLLWRGALVAFTMLVARVGRGLDDGSAARRLVAWVRLWMRETAAMTAAYFAMTIEPLRPRASPPADRVGGPLIILVHGWACNAAVWRPIVRKLRQAAMHDVRCMTLRPVLGSIDAMAAGLERLVPDLRTLGDKQRVVVVAHSMGGLVVRAWLRRLKGGTPPPVTVVTIGTPHRGTRLASFALGTAARQMRLRSTWLAQLDRDAGARQHITCVASGTDNLVAPQENAWFPGARAVEVRAVGHFGLLLAAATFDSVIGACRGDASGPIR
jgi:pimeloyl-ACP methyl ester carboxylesterase